VLFVRFAYSYYEMEPKFQTSFIPKKSLYDSTSTRPKASRMSLLTLLAVIVFLLSLALAGGAFVYGKFTSINIDRKAKELEEAKAAFNPELINELSRLSKKMSVAEDLLNSHISASEIFEALSAATLKSVKFEDFTYNYTPEKITLSMRGESGGFSSIALQSDLFGKSKVIKKPVFSNLNLDEKGNVEFLFTAEVDPAMILYKDTTR